jgi:hypothetical protein
MASPVRDAGTRQDTWVIRVHLDGVPFGVWDKKDGGEVDSDDIKYYPGGMVPPIMLGGKVTTGNVTLQRLYDRIDDHGKINTLIQGAGRANITVSQRPMDPDGNEIGRSIVYTGKLKRVTPPATDSESTTAALYEIEATINGSPSAV